MYRRRSRRRSSPGVRHTADHVERDRPHRSGHRWGRWVDPAKNLIRGGACHTREKLVDSRAERFLVVVDVGKLSDVLGSNFALPVEVAEGLPAGDGPVA